MGQTRSRCRRRLEKLLHLSPPGHHDSDDGGGDHDDGGDNGDYYGGGNNGDDNHVSQPHPLSLDQRRLVHAVLVPQGREWGLHTSSDMFSIKTSPVPTYLFLKINNQI